MPILFPEEWIVPEASQMRAELLNAPEIVATLTMDKVRELTRRCRDCAKIVTESAAAFSVNAGKYLFLFGNRNEEGLQKCVVLAKKTSSEWLRLKTVWVSVENNIFEALPYFAAEYFDLNYNLKRYNCDVELLYWIEDELKDLIKQNLPSMKKKQALLRDWAEFMPRFNKMVSDLDFKVLAKTNPEMDVKSPSQCKDKFELIASLDKLDPGLIHGVSGNKEMDDFLKQLACECRNVGLDFGEYISNVLDMIENDKPYTGIMPEDVKSHIKAERNKSQKPREEMTLNELLAEGKPIEIGEFNRALWKADYSDDIFGKTDKILYETESFSGKDSDFLEVGNPV